MYITAVVAGGGWGLARGEWWRCGELCTGINIATGVLTRGGPQDKFFPSVFLYFPFSYIIYNAQLIYIFFFYSYPFTFLGFLHNLH